MITLLLAVVLRTAIPSQSSLIVERTRFAHELTREYVVKGGLGLQCELAGSMYVLRCDDTVLREFIDVLSASQMHLAITVTRASICVTKRTDIPWIPYEQWLSRMIEEYLFPGRKIHIVDKGVAKILPLYHMPSLKLFTDQMTR
ncbi:MAG: hypothetical protein AAB343_01180 [Patescibacteria group bacterium]